MDDQNLNVRILSGFQTFTVFVNLFYRICPTDSPNENTMMRQETEVTVKGVPLCDYMESIIVNTVSRYADSALGQFIPGQFMALPCLQ